MIYHMMNLGKIKNRREKSGEKRENGMSDGDSDSDSVTAVCHGHCHISLTKKKHGLAQIVFTSFKQQQ
jgi:hypothetical protein